VVLCGMSADNIDRYRFERLGSQVSQAGSPSSRLNHGDPLLRPFMRKVVSSSPNYGTKVETPIHQSLVSSRNPVAPSVWVDRLCGLHVRKYHSRHRKQCHWTILWLLKMTLSEPLGTRWAWDVTVWRSMREMGKLDAAIEMPS
jgi:hypothetical protein